MRGTTAKRLGIYARFLMESDPKYKGMPYKRIKRRLKQLWYQNQEFKKYIQLKVVPNNLSI